MWHHVWQALIVLTCIGTVLGIRYVLIDRSGLWQNPHHIHLLQKSPLKVLRQQVTRWTWLVFFLALTSSFIWREDQTKTKFYPYGRFSLTHTSVVANALPPAAPPHPVYGRFGVITSEKQSP